MAYFIIQNNCTECKDCVSVCMEGAILNLVDKLYIDPMWCTSCGSCAALCYENAIQHEELAQEENILLEHAISDSVPHILEEELC